MNELRRVSIVVEIRYVREVYEMQGMHEARGT